MPRPGFFILHDAAIPDLTAGAYVMRVEHRIDVPGEDEDPIPPRNTHMVITAPRFVMPPDQILSTFPPNQSQGAFSSRLPQIVLRRRTLPWDRRHAGELETIPWLALVVIADGEGELRSNVPVAHCVTPGVTFSGPSDAESGTALRVTETVLRRVFPGKDEVRLLAHVREVDISDTELILGDDDGWMAVVVANRLPQPGVRYRACLISLEGQLDALPDGGAAPVASSFETAEVYPHAAALLRRGSIGEALALAGRGTAVRARTATGMTVGRTTADAWSASRPAPSTRISHTGYGQPNGVPATEVGGVQLEDLHPEEPIFIFPVLAQWTFTCTEAGDFQSRMQELHVGLLGTLKPAPAPPPGKTPPPPVRRPPVVLATGHVELDAITREGDPEPVWYRGPLAPRPGTRNVRDASGILPILHVADQARRLGPDGREDVSLAVAFEIGRLLALAEPAIVAALLRWRRAAFALGRTSAILSHDPRITVLLEAGFSRLPIRLERDLLMDLGVGDGRAIGPVRPSIDPGLPFIAVNDLEATIATGFGVPVNDLAAGPPDVAVVVDANQLLRNGAAGFPEMVAALDVDRDLLTAFAEDLGPGVRP